MGVRVDALAADSGLIRGYIEFTARAPDDGQPTVLNGVPQEETRPSVFTALQEQLGLKLESQKARSRSSSSITLNVPRRTEPSRIPTRTAQPPRKRRPSRLLQNSENPIGLKQSWTRRSSMDIAADASDRA